MSYVVTTIGDCVSCGARKPGLPGAGGAEHLCADCGGSDGRRTVATLAKAREAVADEINERAYSDDQNVMDALYDAAGSFGIEGGTIGPLPDGTIIKVEQEN